MRSINAVPVDIKAVLVYWDIHASLQLQHKVVVIKLSASCFHPIQLFSSMHHCCFFFANLASSGAMGQHGLQYTVAPCRKFQPIEQWMAKGMGITQHAQIHTPEQRFRQTVGSLGRLLGFCVTSRCAFFVKAIFLSTWVRIPPKSHYNHVLFSPLLHQAKTYCTVLRYIVVHCSIERQNHRNPMPHWTGKLVL